MSFTRAGRAVLGEWAENDPVVARFTPIDSGRAARGHFLISEAQVVKGRPQTAHEWLADTGEDHVRRGCS